jgi:hypothetical protein
MATTAGTTSRGLAYPGDTSAADVPAHLKALADSIEAMMDAPVVLGSSLTTDGDLFVTNGGILVSSAGGLGPLGLKDTSAGANLKNSRLQTTAGVTSLKSVTDALAAKKTGLTFDHNTGVVDFPNGVSQKGIGASPYFRAYRSSAASYATGATVIFNTETDPNGWYNTTTGIFLPTVAGTYRVSWGVALFPGELSVDKFLLSQCDHSSLDPIGSAFYQAAAAGAGPVSVGSTLLPFNGTTDTAKIVITHDQGGSVAINTTPAANHFEAEYVGA